MMKPYALTPLLLRQLLSVPMVRQDWEQAAGPDLRVRIANDPPILERDAAIDGIAAFLARVEAVGSGFWAAWRLEEAVFAECDLGFRAGAGLTQTIPCTVVARLADAELIDLRVHCDPTPLPAPCGIDYKTPLPPPAEESRDEG
ncbi:MAG: hypothetical protein A4S12_09925 [Proteobacteria bacterium SG_bin5]|nr:hypothetical protein [Sphingomonas sp.]OQW40598.1 MAG: hypothetical protein A4S12_09925 [Proteobacteria bacterium SG_bin5]